MTSAADTKPDEYEILYQIKEQFAEWCMNDNLNNVVTVPNLFNAFSANELLIECAKYPCPKICMFLLRSVTDVNFKNPESEQTALHVACHASRFEIVKLLCAHKYIDINIKDKFNVTPLHFACTKNENLDMVRFLIEKGADRNAWDSECDSPINYACVFNANQIVDELRLHGFTFIDGTNNYIKKYNADHNNVFSLDAGPKDKTPIKRKYINL